MLTKRCSLCGGKLVQGICTECGLNNNKKRMHQVEEDLEGFKPWTHSSDAFGQEYRENRSGSSSYKRSKEISNDEFFAELRQEQREMEVEDVYHREPPIHNRPVRQPQSRTVQQRTDTQRSTQRGTAQGAQRNERKKKGSCLQVIIFVVIIMIFTGNIFGSLAESVSDLFNDESWGTYEEEYVNTIEFPDASEYDVILEETGERFSETFDAGYYQVGVHLPEGIYSISCTNNGGLVIDDPYSYISNYTYFAEENIGETYEDVYLYEGTIIEITSEASFILASDCANIDGMEYIDNPNTEELTLTETAVAGVDFEAGLYDISIAPNTFASVRFYVSEADMESEEGYSFESMFLCDTEDDMENPFEFSSFENMYLAEGTVIYIDTESEYFEYLTLTPSEIVQNEESTILYEHIYRGYIEE